MRTLISHFTATLILLMAALTPAASSAADITVTPSRNYVTKSFNLKGFETITSNSIIDVEFTQTNGFTKVEITAPENLMQFVKVTTSKNGRKLNLNCDKFRTPNFSGKYRITAKISAPSVNEFVSNGTGDIEFKNALDTKGTLKLTTNGTGDIDGPTILCKRLEAVSNGTGDIEVNSVVCTELMANSVGTGDIDLKSVQASTSTLGLFGTGDIELSSIKTVNLSINLTGTGDINIAGSANSAKYTLTGTGDLCAKDLKAANVTANNHSTGDLECYATESLTVYNTATGDVKYKGNPQTINTNGKNIKRLK